MGNMAVPAIKPGETRIVNNSVWGRYSGSRAEIELLFQRLNNGLQPDVYFGFEYKAQVNNRGEQRSDGQGGCFFVGTDPNVNSTKVSEDYYCKTDSGSYIWD
jgi:hypothetical protein